VLPIPV